MKRLLVLALVAGASSAYADTSRSLYDLMYLPKAGTVYGISTANLLKGRIMDRSGANAFKIDLDGYTFEQSAGYSLTDAFSLTAKIGYNTIHLDNGGSDTNGITDPNFQGRFRMIDTEFRLDILASATVSLGDSKEKGNGDTDAKNGGHDVSAGVQLGHKFADWQWSTTALLTHYFEATTDVSGSGKTKDDAHNGLSLLADALFRVDTAANLKIMTGAILTERYEDNQSGSTPSSNRYLVGWEYQYLVSNDILVRGGLTYSVIKANHIDQNDLFTFSAGANYQF